MVSVQDTSAAFKYGLRTVTKDGVRNVRADEIFTATFLGELSQNDTGLSLESTLNELLAISSRVAGASGKVCPSGYGRETSMDANVVRYGVDAVIDVSEVKQAAKVLGSDGLGDYMSVGDALLVYSGATMMHKHAGAVFAKTKGKVGLKMVDESGKPTHETAMELYAYIEGLKANMANRDKHECTCGRVYPVEDMQAVMRRLAMVNPDSAALFSDPLRYEIRADGRVSRHLRGTCQLLSGKVGEPIFTVSYQGLRLAMRTGYDRWLHEKMRVCCVAQCCCWKLGVREAKESGWYVARNFLCNDRTVCGRTDMAKHALHTMGLKPQRADKNGMWYDYDPVVANRWLEGVMKTPPKKIIGGEIMHWKCSIVVFRMLIAWFDYIQNGKISLGDALHAVDFAESGDVLNVSVVTDGLYLTDGYDTRCG